MKNKSIFLLVISMFMMITIVLSCTSRKSLPIEGPLTLNEQEQAGEIVFMQHCHRCHPHGEAGLGPGIYPVPDFAKRLQIRHGVGAMPAFDEGHISDKEVEQVLSYLKALNKIHKIDKLMFSFIFFNLIYASSPVIYWLEDPL